ncbi:MAG TPA: dUTP diphosphatase [Chitinophagaceae bacterium]|nr:dUTP diphosphatase [Chitinophagaceae bacterium]
MKTDQGIRVINRSRNPLPAYATQGAAGMDLRADLGEDLVILPLQRVLVPTGLFIELPGGFEAQIRPRSGLAVKQGLTLLNSPGTIDPDYRGEIKVLMVNLSPEPQTIAAGERIAQMVIASFTRLDWEEVGSLTESDRGGQGFGHTGKI